MTVQLDPDAILAAALPEVIPAARRQAIAEELLARLGEAGWRLVSRADPTREVRFMRKAVEEASGS